MRSLLVEELRKCADVRAVLTCVLDCSLAVTAAPFGNVQLMDWTSGCLRIEGQRGFDAEFLNFFRRVGLTHGSACGRALRSRGTIVIDDIMIDRDFSPYRDIARRAGIRAIQSTPLVSSSGAMVGVVSNHFAAVQRPTELQRRELEKAAELAANAIIRLQAKDHEQLIESSLELLERSYRAIDDAERLLSRTRRARIGDDLECRG